MIAEAQVKSFLQAATKGEAVLSPSVLEEFEQECRQALEKQFNRNPEWRIRMSARLFSSPKWISERWNMRRNSVAMRSR